MSSWAKSARAAASYPHAFGALVPAAAPGRLARSRKSDAAIGPREVGMRSEEDRGRRATSRQSASATTLVGPPDAAASAAAPGSPARWVPRLLHDAPGASIASARRPGFASPRAYAAGPSPAAARIRAGSRPRSERSAARGSANLRARCSPHAAPHERARARRRRAPGGRGPSFEAGCSRGDLPRCSTSRLAGRRRWAASSLGVARVTRARDRAASGAGVRAPRIRRGTCRGRAPPRQ